MRRVIFSPSGAVLVLCLCSGWSVGQTLKPRPAAEEQYNNDSRSQQGTSAEDAGGAPVVVAMSVAAGTPIKVALDSEVRVREVGQAIHGKTTEPVYAFDKLLIPVGTVVNGKVSAIDAVPKKVRTLDATDGNFSPRRNVHVQFDELVMSDGRHVPLQTVASPAPDGVLRFVSANEKAEPKNKVQDAAEKKISATRQEIRRQWSELQKQIHEPGKMHKLKRIAVAQLPVHPQYIEVGTSFNADLQQPLDFGTEAVKPEALTNIGAPPPTGSVVHARLVTPLNSSTARKGDPVEALITEPLVVSDHLILPEGSVIKGSVMQAVANFVSSGCAAEWGRAESRDQPGRRGRGQGRALKAGCGRRRAGNDAADEVFDDRNCGDAGRVAGVPRSRCGAGPKHWRSGPGRGERSVGIPLRGNDRGAGGALAHGVTGIRILWSGVVNLLPFSGARAGCSLSERYGDGDWAGNARSGQVGFWLLA